MERIETGALQINDDWTGLFVRGDDALMLRDILASVYSGHILDGNINALVYKYIRIIDCEVDEKHGKEREVQRIKVEECA